jgi:hypothetical protein
MDMLCASFGFELLAVLSSDKAQGEDPQDGLPEGFSFYGLCL